MESASPAPLEPERPPRPPVWPWLRDLTLSVIVAVVVILFIYQPVEVEGTSMMPALVDQDRVFINKITYRMGIEKIARGDTIVFNFPGDPHKSYIKRVIGVPGDVVRIDEGVVRVNGRALSEDYVPAEYRDSASMPEMAVTPDHFFVLGDHRSSSSDSRSWGLVDRDSIYGRAVFVYWPLAKMGPVH